MGPTIIPANRQRFTHRAAQFGPFNHVQSAATGHSFARIVAATGIALGPEPDQSILVTPCHPAVQGQQYWRVGNICTREEYFERSCVFVHPPSSAYRDGVASTK